LVATRGWVWGGTVEEGGTGEEVVGADRAACVFRAPYLRNAASAAACRGVGAFSADGDPDVDDESVPELDPDELGSFDDCEGAGGGTVGASVVADGGGAGAGVCCTGVGGRTTGAGAA